MPHDYFSSVAAEYARYRPTYPATLFDWLVDVAPARDVAWDCACGTGQATLPLAERFAHVIATDHSAEQLRHAPPHDRIAWRVAPAEASGIDAGTVDLVTVAQALHWFDLPRFWAEVRRVLRPGGVIAAWTYGVASVDDPELTNALRTFHDEGVGAWWPVERGHVEARYVDIDFPFHRLAPPPPVLTADWSLDQLLGYLRTWSAVRRYVAAEHADPVTGFGAAIGPRWGGGTREVRWPLTLIAGTTDGA